MTRDAEIALHQYLLDQPEIFARIGEQVDDPLRIQKQLRAAFPADVVRLALTITALRHKAKQRGLPHAERLWFDRVRLEQSTAWPVARHKAARFFGRIHDFCCGAGIDALALAGRGEVSALDADPLACWLAQQNARVFGASSRIEVKCAPVETINVREGLLHIDPDRRAGTAGRAVRLDDYEPPLDSLRRLADEFPGGAIKLSPAANFGGKFDGVEIELVSLEGECKEATIWFGTLAKEYPWRATALPSGATIAGDPLSAEPMLADLGNYLFDPDPALVRAGLIDMFCAERDIKRLDLAEEYLTSDARLDDPFVTPFRVLAELPNNETVLKRRLRELSAGVVEIKARHLPVPVERLQKSLPRTGNRRLVVIFCRVAGRSRIVIAERM